MPASMWARVAPPRVRLVPRQLRGSRTINTTLFAFFEGINSRKIPKNQNKIQKIP